MTSPLSRICSFSVHPTDFGLANFHSHVSQFLKINLCLSLSDSRASLVAQRLKHLPPMQETRVRFLGQEDPLEKEMVTHSSILAWRIPWMEKPTLSISKSVSIFLIGSAFLENLNTLIKSFLRGESCRLGLQK